MANTENIEAKLAAYVDGELDAAGRAEIETYLTTNPQHRQLIDELRQAKNYLQELPRAAAPVEVAEMIAQQLERAALLGDVEIGEGGTHFARWPQLRAIAAILLLTVGLAGVLYYVLPSPKPMSPQSAVITPEIPHDDSPSSSMEMARARPASPSVAAADAPARVEGRIDPTVAAPDADSTAIAGVVDRSNVGRLLGGAAGGAGGSGVAPSGALYLMVNTPDPATANTQVVNYFASNRISYEQVAGANDSTLGENKTLADANLSPAAPATTRPEFDNVAPDAKHVDAPNDSLKETATATTIPTDKIPTDKLELAKNSSLETAQKQQSSFVCYKAKMTREEVENLGQTLSQPQLRQVAQIMPQDYRGQQQVQSKGDLEDEATRREKSAPEQQQGYGQTSASTTNESSPTTDQLRQYAPAPAAAPEPAPAYAERAGQRSDVLAAGDNIRIRTSDPLRADSQPHEETQVIDEEGYVSLPNVGRVKAAGLTPYQLSSSVIPQSQERSRDSQSPNVRLVFTIEKIALESNFAPDQKFPATREAGALALSAPPAETLEPTTGPTAPTTHPTTNPTELAAGIPLPSSDREKIDVVVIVQNADGPTTAPALLQEMSIERRAAEPISPSSQPAISSPTTAPTTAPTTLPTR